MNVDLRGRHDLSEIVGYAYRLYGLHFAAFILIAAITMPFQLLIGVIQQSSDSDAASVAATLLNLPAALVTLLASAAIIAAVHEATAGAKPEFGTSLDAAIARLGALITSALLGGVLAVLAFVAAPALAVWWALRRDATIDGRRDWWLALIPGALGFYLVIRWGFQQQAVMIGGHRNWSALNDSAHAVRGYWWRTVGILLVIALIQLGPILLSQSATLLPPLAASAIIAAVFALVLPFSVTAQTLLYYDLKARKQDDLSADRLPPAEPDLPGESP